LRLLILGATSALARAQRTVVSVDWATPVGVGTLRTTLTYQVVVNPLTTRGSPIHTAIHDAIRTLNATLVRYVPWLPYPRLGVAELERPSRGLCGFRSSDSGAFPLTLSCGGSE